MQRLFWIFLVGYFFLSIVACQKSQIGKWLEYDKKKLLNTCEKDFLTMFKTQETSYLNITEKEIKNICVCASQKIEKIFLPKKYTSKDILPISQKCFADEIFGQKGNWKPKFKESYTNLVKKEMGIKGEPTTEEMVLLQCFIAKYEQETDIECLVDIDYANIHTKRLMEDCVKELGN